MFKRGRRDSLAMPFPTIRSCAAAVLLLAAGASAPSPGEAQRYGQVVIQERTLIRIAPSARPASASAPAPARWKEKKGPKCVAMRAIAGAALVGENSVDLILRDRSRIRARLEKRCPALDYYHGFYVTPTADGQMCAERDMIRSRLGGECGIDRFRTLELVRAE